MHRADHQATNTPAHFELPFDRNSGAPSIHLDESEESWPVGSEVRVAIAHGSPVIASGLASWIRQRTALEVSFLHTRDCSPWDELIGKHVVLVDERTVVRALRTDRESLTRRSPWTRVVLVTDQSPTTAAQLDPVGIDAVIRDGCAPETFVDALRPLVAELTNATARAPGSVAEGIEPSVGSKAGGVNRGGLTRMALQRVRHYVEQNLAERIDVEDLAAMAGLSVCHFARAFRQSMGVPPHRYVLLRRIHAAAELVRDTERAFAEIATTVGFSDQSHFTRVFVRMTGDTPRSFRRLHR